MTEDSGDSTDPIETLARVFGLPIEAAEDLLQLTFAVDQHIAIRQYGYPKDNLIPPPMHERLANREYLRLLLSEVSEEDGEFGEDVLAAIRGHWERISQQEKSGDAQ